MPDGPVQVLVLGVPDGAAARHVASAVAGAPAGQQVRVLDVLLVEHDAAEGLQVDPADGWSGASAPLFAAGDATEGPADGEVELWHLGDLVAPGQRAVVVLVEHPWAVPLRDALVAAAGSVRHDTWLHPDDRSTLGTLLP